MRIMLANGDVVKASPTENADIFRHALGGYGLFGVILDADLDLVDNEMYARKAVYVDYIDFPEYYRRHVENNNDMGLFVERLSVDPKSCLLITVVLLFSKT